MSKWREVWLDNYNNKSEAAKNIDELMKKNYKGHKYVPWAVMVKWLYLMDENAELEVLYNAVGGNVFTDTVDIVSKTYTTKNARKDEKREDTGKQEEIEVKRHSHFVKVHCKFLGKDVVETYPVQDNAYNAPNYIDSNMVNKAIQRAKAKVISVATGLGYQLYEFGDLQFEEDTKKPEVKTPEVKKPEVKKPVPKEQKDESEDDFATKIYDKLQTYGDKALPVLQAVNPSLVKNYKFSILLEDTVDTLREKLSKISNVTLFEKMLYKRFEHLDKENA